MPVSDKIPPTIESVPDTLLATEHQERAHLATVASRPPDDGTRMLLQSGFWIVVGGLLSLLATETIFGGIGIQGAHTNAGWISLMFALMSVPFGLMLLVLGIAKWLRNWRNRRVLSGPVVANGGK